MFKSLRWLVLALCACHAGLATAAGAPSAGSSGDRFVLQAVYSNGRLWLLTDDGAVSSLDLENGKRTASETGGSALALCSNAGDLWTLTTPGDTRTPRFMTLRVKSGDTWKPLTRIPFHYQLFYGMSCTHGTLAVLTDSHLFTWADGRLRRVTLSPKLDMTLNYGTLAQPGRHVYFAGFNAGEFGGGLYRIDARSGAVHEVVSTAKVGVHSLCGLLTGCDAVNAIVPEPWEPRCMAVAVGIVHLMSYGRIVSVCPDGISLLFSAPSETDAFRDIIRQKNKHASLPDTAAMFGLVRVGGDLLAVSPDGLFRIDADGHATKLALPRFHDVSGIDMNTSLPNVILLLTVMNQGHSLSGITPLLVPRTAP